MACYQTPGPLAVRSAFKDAIGVLPNHSEWVEARALGAADVVQEIKDAKRLGMPVPGGPKSFASSDEAVKAVFAMYESLGYDHEQAWQAPGAHDLITQLSDGKLQMRRAQVAGLKHLTRLTSSKIEALPANRIVLTGTMSKETLQRALYNGWTIERFEKSPHHDRVQAILRAPDSQSPGFGLEPQAERLRSFGTVAVRTFEPDDMTLHPDTVSRFERLTGLSAGEYGDNVAAGHFEVITNDMDEAYDYVQREFVLVENSMFANVDRSEADNAREFLKDVLTSAGVPKKRLDEVADRIIKDAVDSYDPTPY